MATSYSVLAQSAPLVTTLTDIYTVPADTQTVVSTIVVCNRAGSATAFRLSVAVAGAGNATSQYLCYDTPIAANSSFTLTLGVTLDETDVVRAYATAAQLTFSLFGAEITA